MAQVAPDPNLQANPSAGRNLFTAADTIIGNRTAYEFWLTLIIIAFGLSVILILLWHFRRTNRSSTEDFTRSVVVIMVVTAALILVTAGYSNEQIAPAFGLFGTIIGYTLGRLSKRDDSADPEG
ncbi:hypothetical protein [Mesorhizobium sp. M2E.F.Ca.ET.219.01.1.1]|uniref:hypothetical protein n=1 Tax=Mesorhizobium sp. M2E.F.Ca.ET.219.01.1.1 TaxID=2500530 RepID=UPI000FDBC343|nr:hypothetical protein [Mesorhizobium sp. M2E.F.Ca.ET.219.01.1.1]TGQ04490.1 hypothetical protein EN862_032880 [Mesorhizobium sp. M2E.F.Ca.ET.219.01.1.1]